MGAYILNPTTISSIWHDAEIDSMQIDWASQGDMHVVLHAELNPEENMDQLSVLGITSRFVSIRFGTVWRFQTDITGDYAAKSTIDAWEVHIQSTLLDLAHRGRPPISGSVHHHISTSSGSVFDIVCTDMWIESRDLSDKS